MRNQSFMQTVSQNSLRKPEQMTNVIHESPEKPQFLLARLPVPNRAKKRKKLLAQLLFQ